MRMVLLSFLIVLGSSNGLAAYDRPLTSVEDLVMVSVSRRDAIPQRLKSLKQPSVESRSPTDSDIWMDKNGVLRLRSGRPIGHWGIDWPSRQVIR
jgi:hypothetical protein